MEREVVTQEFLENCISVTEKLRRFKYVCIAVAIAVVGIAACVALVKIIEQLGFVALLFIGGLAFTVWIFYFVEKCY